MNKIGLRIWREVKSLFVIFLIALALRATVIEAYIVPTGSMENTIMTGDFLIGNKFVYGMRTPDWIGIPYTDWGIFIPWVRFPAFRHPKQGNVVIFKYPRDVFQKYVKRCIAGPGQTVAITRKKVSVDGKEFALPPAGKFLSPIFEPGTQQWDIFLRKGNRDNLGPIYVPKEGDTLWVHDKSNWSYLLPIMMMDGHKITLRGNGETEFMIEDVAMARWLRQPLKGEYTFTEFDPIDVERRKKTGGRIFGKFKQERMINPWRVVLPSNATDYLYMDGRPFTNLSYYIVGQDYFWMMGDNRDDSADSRYWGFVPHKYILGEALFSYMSWDFQKHIVRYWRIGKIIS